MILENEVNFNDIYAWDVRGTLRVIHVGTKHVKILEVQKRRDAAPLATVQSIETGERFQTDIGHLTTITEVREMVAYYDAHPEVKPNGAFSSDDNWEKEKARLRSFLPDPIQELLNELEVYFNQVYIDLETAIRAT